MPVGWLARLAPEKNVTIESLPDRRLKRYVLVTFLGRMQLKFSVRNLRIVLTSMTKSKKDNAGASEKLVTLKLEVATAEQKVEAVRVCVHAAKENLKLARKDLKRAKIDAKQARKAFKSEKKLAKNGTKKTSGKKRGKPVLKKVQATA